jgi:hypothetical protein
VTAVVRRSDLAEAAAHAALDVPGVAGLSAGTGVEVATYYPGGKTLGIRLREDGAEVHIVAGRSPLQPLAEEVAVAVGQVLTAAGASRPVTVVVDDVAPEALDRRNRD